MREYVIRDGRGRHAVDIDRGALLVRPEEEWRRRHDAVHWRNWWRGYAVMGALLMLVPAFFLWLDHEYPQPGHPNLWVALLMAVAVVVLVSAFVLNLRRSLDRGPAVGVYERGYQLSYCVFVPYGEIEGTERVRVRSREPNFVVLRVRGHTGDPLRVSMEFLGGEGVEELERRVRAAGLMEKPI